MAGHVGKGTEKKERAGLSNVSEQDETELRAEIRRRREIYKFGKLPVSPLTKILRERLSK